jgi:nitroreductase
VRLDRPAKSESQGLLRRSDQPRANGVGDSRHSAAENTYRPLRQRIAPCKLAPVARGHGLRDLFDILWQRHTCRTAYDPAMAISEEDLRRILDAARWAPTAHNIQNFEIVVVDDKQRLSAISAIRMPPAETFIRETYHPLSMSDAESLHKRTGLSASMLPESWLEPETVNDEADSPPRTFVGHTIPPCPALLIVVYDVRLGTATADAASEDLMSLGCVMQNMWLMTESLGISMQVLTGLGATAVESRVRSILDIPQHLRIAFAARLGYPIDDSESYLRVRRKIRDFTHYNRYGVLDLPAVQV